MIIYDEYYLDKRLDKSYFHIHEPSAHVESFHNLLKKLDKEEPNTTEYFSISSFCINPPLVFDTRRIIDVFGVTIQKHLIYYIEKNNIELCKGSTCMSYWAKNVLLDGILFAYTKELSNSVGFQYFDTLFSRSFHLIHTWIKDIGIGRLPLCPYTITNYVSGQVIEVNPNGFRICKNCLKEFDEMIETDEGEKIILIDRDHLHPKTLETTDKDSCKNKYKKLFRNPIYTKRTIAEDKLKLLFKLLFDKESFNDYLEEIKNIYSSQRDKHEKEVYESINEIGKSTETDPEQLFNYVYDFVVGTAKRFADKVLDSKLNSAPDVYNPYIDFKIHAYVQPNKQPKIKEAFDSSINNGLIKLNDVAIKLDKSAVEIVDLYLKYVDGLL